MSNSPSPFPSASPTLARPRGRVLCFTSAKGGSGKTVFAVCAAYALLRAGKRVLCIDTDFSTRGLSLFLLGSTTEGRGELPASSCLADALLASLPPESLRPLTIVHETVEFSVLVTNRNLFQGGVPEERLLGAAEVQGAHGPSPLSSYASYLRRVCEVMREVYDYIVIDTRGGFDVTSVVPAVISDGYCIVLEADAISVQQVHGLKTKIDEYTTVLEGIHHLEGFIVNKALYAPEDQGFVETVARLYGGRALGTVPADRLAIRAYQRKLVPLDVAPQSDFAHYTYAAISNLIGQDLARWSKTESQAFSDLGRSIRRLWRIRTTFEGASRIARHVALGTLVLASLAYAIVRFNFTAAGVAIVYALAGLTVLGFAVNVFTLLLSAWSQDREMGEHKGRTVVAAASMIGLIVLIAYIVSIDVPRAAQRARLSALGEQTQYVNEFPRNIPAITELIEETRLGLLIVSDFCAYGHYSNPAAYAAYKETLIKQRAAGVDIEMHIYDRRRANESTAEQFDLAEPTTASANYKAMRQSEVYRNYFRFHRARGIDLTEPETVSEFAALMAADQAACVDELRAAGIRVAADISARLPLFIWLSDQQRAIFSVFNLGHGAREVSLATNDRNLVVMLGEIAARRGDDIPSIEEIGDLTGR